MAENKIPNVFSPETGIERILWNEDQITTGLPEERGAITPSEDLFDLRLNRLFEATTLENLILAWLRPSLNDKNIIIPARYQAMLQEVHQRLEQMLTEMDDAESRQALQDAVSLINEEIEHRGLLNTYINLLHRA
jgi:hypothetical protein